MNKKTILIPAFLGALFFINGCSQAPAPEMKKSRIRIVWPQPPDVPRIEYVGTFSSPEELGIKASWFKKFHRAITGKKKKATRIASPVSLFVDDKGRIYVTDSFTRSVHVFDKKSRKYLEVFSAQKEPLLSPIGVTVDTRGRIYVTDSVQKKVYVFSRKGKLVFSFGAGNLSRPTGIAFEPDPGYIYVVDTLDHQVKIFNQNGEYLHSIGKRGEGPGEFNFPIYIYIDKRRLIYVGDTMNFRIQVFGHDGKYITSFGQAGDGTGYFSKIKGVAVDSEGHIYVSDAQFDVVQVFNIKGEYLLSFGNSGQGPGEFSLPSGIFIDKMDNIYVADRLNQRVQIFRYLKEVSQK